MAGLKERRLKRYQRGEEGYNDSVARILREGSIGHTEKHRRRMSSDPSVTDKVLQDQRRGAATP